MKLENQKFGRLLVVKKDPNKGDINHPYWICKCDCGNQKSIRQDVLRNGSTKSCGCLAKELSRKRIIENGIAGHNFQNLVGKQFSYLKVIELIDKKWIGSRYVVSYKCRCNCGKEIIVEANNLRSLHTTSCGCKKDSYGVFTITNILKELKIDFEKEKIFPDCKSDKNAYLRMDFYLPQYNTVIEVDGQQHNYTKSNGFYTEEKIKRIKELDLIKNNYCKEKNINLIRIPYSEWKQLNSEYITNKLNGL